MENSEIDFLLDDIRKACELGEIGEVILLSEKLKEKYVNTSHPKNIGNYKKITEGILKNKPTS